MDNSSERRRGARHFLPKLTVTIDSERVDTADWSIRGFRLEPSTLALVYVPGEVVAGTISHPELPEHLFVGRVTRCQQTQQILAIEIAGRDEMLERFERYQIAS